MGDRAQIVVVQEKDKAEPRIYIYSHWGGEGMGATLAHALIRANDANKGGGCSRWDDTAYLTRVLAEVVMEQTGFGQNLGCGISCFSMGPEWPDLVVDPYHQTVTVDGDGEAQEGLVTGKVYTFREFILATTGVTVP